MNRTLPRRSLLLALLVVVAAGRALAAPPRAGSSWVVGSGGSFITNPNEHHYGVVHPRPGFRAGLLLTVPQTRFASIDLGLLLDIRGAGYHDAWWSSYPVVHYVEIERTYTLSYLVAPLRLRLGPDQGTLRPYVTFGPELFLMLLLRDSGKTQRFGRTFRDSGEFSSETDRISTGLYAGTGLARLVRDRECFLELGLSLGMGEISRYSSGFRYSPSGLGDARTRSILLSVGVKRRPAGRNLSTNSRASRSNGT